MDKRSQLQAPAALSPGILDHYGNTFRMEWREVLF